MPRSLFARLRQKHAPKRADAVTRREMLLTTLAASAGLAPDSLSSGPVQLTWHQTDNQPGVGTAMVAFSGGPNAEECRSWSAAERVQRYMDSLSPVFGGLPGALMRHRFMDWPGDAWSKGSYSFPAPGQITTFGETLWNGTGRMRFAGEHCAYAFSGYMEGALHAGVHAASAIVDA